MDRDRARETDVSLVRRLLRDDDEAFERFFEAVYPALYRFALVRLDFDADAAGEVAQSALCNAVAKLSTFRGEATLLTWLFTFCRREVYAWRKSRTRFQHVELAEDDPEVRAALDSLRRVETDDVERGLERSATGALVRRTLDQLPTHYAHALEWKYVDGLPVREIGARLGLGAKAAESMLARARHTFREAFSAMAARQGWDPREG